MTPCIATTASFVPAIDIAVVSVIVIFGFTFETTAPVEADLTCSSRCRSVSPFMAIELPIIDPETMTSPVFSFIFFASACVYMVSSGPTFSVSE